MAACARFALTLVLAFGLALGAVPDAHAKRFGGGASFGGKSSYATPYKRQAAAPARPAAQTRAAEKNQAVRQDLARRGGLIGMLGGLALGGLLGALLFGGAFEHLNLVDMLCFAALGFLLFRLLAMRPARPARAPAGAAAQAAPPMAARAAAGTFDSSTWFRGAPAVAVDYNVPQAPAGFDVEDFLAGARIAYRDLQQAWAADDREAIRRLTTPAMYEEVAARLGAAAADERTDVLKLEAELLEAREFGGALEAVVLFDAVLREARDARPQQVREVWHFTRAVDSARPTWFLDGIQQLED